MQYVSKIFQNPFRLLKSKAPANNDLPVIISGDGPVDSFTVNKVIKDLSSDYDIDRKLLPQIQWDPTMSPTLKGALIPNKYIIKLNPKFEAQNIFTTLAHEFYHASTAILKGSLSKKELEGFLGQSFVKMIANSKFTIFPLLVLASDKDTIDGWLDFSDTTVKQHKKIAELFEELVVKQLKENHYFFNNWKKAFYNKGETEKKLLPKQEQEYWQCLLDTFVFFYKQYTVSKGSKNLRKHEMGFKPLNPVNLLENSLIALLSNIKRSFEQDKSQNLFVDNQTYNNYYFSQEEAMAKIKENSLCLKIFEKLNSSNLGDNEKTIINNATDEINRRTNLLQTGTKLLDTVVDKLNYNKTLSDLQAFDKDSALDKLYLMIQKSYENSEWTKQVIHYYYSYPAERNKLQLEPNLDTKLLCLYKAIDQLATEQNKK